ncbi:MAG: hypothetical protein QM666_11120 [Acinetobacter sp.]
MHNADVGIFQQFLSLLDDFPEDIIAISVYIIGALVVMISWYFITRAHPRFCAFTSLILFAGIATPTVSEGTNASISPAIFGLLFGVLTHEDALIWINLGLILFVIGIGCLVGFLWSKFFSQKRQKVHQQPPL